MSVCARVCMCVCARVCIVFMAYGHLKPKRIIMPYTLVTGREDLHTYGWKMVEVSTSKQA